MKSNLIISLDDLRKHHTTIYQNILYTIKNRNQSHTKDIVAQNYFLATPSKKQNFLIEGRDSKSSLTKQREPTIYFNLTTSKFWKTLPVGIVRVERELAKHLFHRENRACHFVIWDKLNSTFKLLLDDEVQAILDDSWCDSSKIIEFDKSQNAGNVSTIVPGDFLISIGLDWDLSPVSEVAKFVNENGCRTIMACYDTIPLILPEFTAHAGMHQLFKQHFVDMAHVSYKIFAISENSKQDLLQFFESSCTLSTLPEVEVVTLAGWPKSRKLPDLSAVDLDRLRHLNAMGDFALYVSHLEPRKNHRMLINLWKDLYQRRGDQCPQLVFIGRRGWCVNELIEQMKRSDAYQNQKIYWFEDVSDEFLLNLYYHCSFSLFPSFYEGWGLPVTESMSFGKVCVISKIRALEEASQCLMPSYHPQDFLGWRSEVDKLLDDQHYKQALEKTILDKYQPKLWHDFSKEFCDKLLIN